MLAEDSELDKVSLKIWKRKDKMNKALSGDKTQAELLQVLMAQWPGRISLTRSESAKTLGYKNAITVDRLRSAGCCAIHRNAQADVPTYGDRAFSDRNLGGHMKPCPEFLPI